MDLRTLPHRLLVIFLAGTIVVFGMMTGHSRKTRQGVYFYGGLLKVTEVSEKVTQYSGLVRNAVVTITCETVGGTATKVAYQTTAIPEPREYVMEYPLAEVQTEHGTVVPGIRITEGETVLFSGGYGPDPAGGMSWYTEDGERTAMQGFDAAKAAGGRAPEELNRYQVAELALGPEIYVQGSWIDYGVSVGFALVTILCVMYPGALLPIRNRRIMRNGEPTALFFIASTAIGCLLTAVCLWSYYRALMRMVVLV